MWLEPQGRNRAGSGSVPWIMVILGVLWGCDSVTEPVGPKVVSMEIAATGPLVQRLSLELETASPVEVRYWSDEEAVMRIESDRALSHEIDLARLRPARDYQLRIVGTEHSGRFSTEPLPSDLAAIGFEATGRLSVPLVFLHVFNPEGFRGYVVVDSTGGVVWYWRSEGFPFGMARRADGSFVFMDEDRGLVQVSPSGEVIAELPQSEERQQHHDVVTTPDNTLLFLVFDSRVVDGEPLKGEAVWEWRPEESSAARRWSSWDHMDPVEDRGPRFGTEWLHANSLHVGPRGNTIVSLHYLNQVVSISPGWDSLEWRLGGVNATIPMPEGERFTGQHTAREIGLDRLVLFDNRFEDAEPSRALELDITGPQAAVVWSWASDEGNYSSAVSSARRLPGGNTMVGFGMSQDLFGSTGPIEVFEVTPGGHTTWHLEVRDVQVMFRAEPLWTIAGEELLR
jgi:hypothetical protein